VPWAAAANPAKIERAKTRWFWYIANEFRGDSSKKMMGALI
jgi:hypothetical protein